MLAHGRKSQRLPGPPRPHHTRLPLILRSARVLSPLLLLVLAPGLAAQAPVVVPATASTPLGDYFDLSLFYGGIANRSHTQALYATSEVGLRTGAIHGLRFRASSNESGGAQATDVFVTIEMSVSPVSPAQASATFAANHGSNRTIVYSGLVHLPARATGVVWPAPWEAPIAFPTPFAYDGNAGQSLVVDVSTSGNTSHAPWAASSATVDYGTTDVELIQGLCTTFGEQNLSGSWGYSQFQPMLGQTFSLSHLGYASRPSFQFSWLLFGFGATGTPFGGGTLPVTLQSLGLPADPECFLAVQPDLVVPMQYFPGSRGGVGAIGYSMTLPSDPLWLGATFYTQSISLDYDNGTMVEPWVFPSLALKWTFGSGQRPLASRLSRIGDTVVPQATGQITLGEAPVFELDLR